jgi:hypothetical protein
MTSTSSRPAVDTAEPRRARTPWRPWLVGWLGLVLVALLNGTLRQLGYQRWIGELAGRQVATVLMIVLSACFIWLLHRRWPIPSTGAALRIGGVWTVLTLSFEFGFGLFVERAPLSTLLADYNVAAGRIWILVPIWVVVAPEVIRRLQARR